MPKLKKISGKECIKVLCNRFGFAIVRQKGSHVILKKEVAGKRTGVVVPLHPELKIGTLKGILEQAGIPEWDFSEAI